MEVETDEQYRQKKIVAQVSDTAGRKVKVTGEYFAHFPLVPVPSCTLIEGAMRCEVDGRPGVGWSEFMWPTSYLQFLQTRTKGCGMGTSRAACEPVGRLRPLLLVRIPTKSATDSD